MKLEGLGPLRSMNDHFNERYRDRQIEAPREIVQAFVGLIGDASLVSAAVSEYRCNRSTHPAQARWECMALAADSVFQVTGYRSGGDWFPGCDEPVQGPPAPSVFGRILPLSELSEVRLLRLVSSDAENFTCDYQLVVRGSDALAIPRPENDNGHQLHEAFAREVIRRLR
ncbi:hypothetical protein EV652_103394 [Kribbella steppae]|uniref:Uncharacterized protein n=1 Tax=Kribbella steppae TaxID=2512223 RepID=A0A4R2HQ91_9ACTN|nr:hypothetical protein [Kribbella steppae]TCO33393.1 hypothetical protein EV652_103394 [Kribbella steppae]